ncbi:MAG: DUF5320 domain-containing protein [Nanoarchaeota archaeon]|nr:DUF5320 domain-containing protein [Nanoarchaeota archaeon]
MPGYDGTGPAGMGPMTGRGAGYCTPGTTPVNTGTGVVYGGGRGRAFGGGRGRGSRGGNGMYNPRGFIRPRFVAVSPSELEKKIKK